MRISSAQQALCATRGGVLTFPKDGRPHGPPQRPSRHLSTEARLRSHTRARARPRDPGTGRRAQVHGAQARRHPAPLRSAARDRRRARQLGLSQGPQLRPGARSGSRWRPRTTRSPTATSRVASPTGSTAPATRIIWDRGTYDTVPPGQAQEQRRKGHLHVVFDGEKLKGGWHLVRTRAARAARRSGSSSRPRTATRAPDFDVVAERPESVASGRRVTRGPERQRSAAGARTRDPDTLLAERLAADAGDAARQGDSGAGGSLRLRGEVRRLPRARRDLRAAGSRSGRATRSTSPRASPGWRRRCRSSSSARRCSMASWSRSTTQGASRFQQLGERERRAPLRRLRSAVARRGGPPRRGRSRSGASCSSA